MSRPDIGTIFALEVPFPRAAAHSDDELTLSTIGGVAAPRGGFPAVTVPTTVTSTSSTASAGGTPGSPHGPSAGDVDMVALLAMIGGGPVDVAAAPPPPVPVSSPPRMVVAGARVLLVDDDVFVLAVANGACAAPQFPSLCGLVSP